MTVYLSPHQLLRLLDFVQKQLCLVLATVTSSRTVFNRMNMKQLHRGQKSHILAGYKCSYPPPPDELADENTFRASGLCAALSFQFMGVVVAGDNKHL